jgi:hypothetical protein
LSLGMCAFKAESMVLALSSARQKCVRQAWEKADISTKWAATRWAKKIEARERVMAMGHLNCGGLGFWSWKVV